MADTPMPQTIGDFVRVHHISMSADRTDSNPNMQDSENMDHWRCVLRMGRKRLTTYFSMGYKVFLGVSGVDIADTESFESFCADYGYDTDSRKAERTFLAVKRQAQRLHRFLGPLQAETLQDCEGE